MSIEVEDPFAGLPGAPMLPRVASVLREGRERLVDLFLPQRCAACGGPVTAAGLCGGCWTKVDFISKPYCQRLGTPFSYDSGALLTSPAAIAEPPDYGRARAVARYEGPARALVHALKFHDRLEMADVLAAQMVRAGAGLIGECDVVVPVPLHRRRLFTRRFNQSALLAERIARLSRLDYAAVAITRVKATRHQVGLSRPERQRNLSGAFKVLPEMRPLVEGRRVLLVDDVMTTGATANACARVGLRAGAASVDVLTFARVVAAV
jgi:ComF family protein